VSVTREEVAEMLSFLERSKTAHLITCSTVTRRPLFAHWFYPTPWKFVGSVDVKILWCGEPSHETRVVEERIRARKMFEIHREEIDYAAARPSLLDEKGENE
jgi:hypothetical protein